MTATAEQRERERGEQQPESNAVVQGMMPSRTFIAVAPANLDEDFTPVHSVHHHITQDKVETLAKRPLDVGLERAKAFLS